MIAVASHWKVVDSLHVASWTSASHVRQKHGQVLVLAEAWIRKDPESIDLKESLSKWCSKSMVDSWRYYIAVFGSLVFTPGIKVDVVEVLNWLFAIVNNDGKKHEDITVVKSKLGQSEFVAAQDFPWHQSKWYYSTNDHKTYVLSVMHKKFSCLWCSVSIAFFLFSLWDTHVEQTSVAEVPSPRL